MPLYKSYDRFLAILGMTICYSGLSLANQMTFEIGRSVNGFNTPFVSVTVCKPGTKLCKTIDRIKLDTGSEGLKIYKSALQGFKLPIQHDDKKNNIALCSTLGGGSVYWGPIASADLFLGDEFAKGASIQVVDPTFPAPNVNCVSTSFPDGRNGILGMDTAVGSPNGKTYFSCNSKSCASVVLTSTKQPLNPIIYFLKDNNGFTIRTPSLPPAGQSNLKGSIIFGIGTQPNNQPKAGLTSCHVRSDDYFQLKYNGIIYWTKFDSGTNAYSFPPAAVNVPFCKNSKIYLCPLQPTTYQVELLNFDGSVCTSLNLDIIGNIFDFSSVTQSWVLPGLAETWGELMPESFILGMPFFFGKDISYVIQGHSSPWGTGPIVAL